VGFLGLTIFWLRFIIVVKEMGTLSFQTGVPIISFSFVLLIIFAGLFLGVIEASIFAVLSSVITLITFFITRDPFFLLNLLMFSGVVFIFHQQKEKERKIQNQSIIDIEGIREEYNTLKSEYERQKFLTLAFKKRFEKFSQLGKITEILSYTLKVEETLSVVASKSFELLGKGERLKVFLTKKGAQSLVLRIEGEVKEDKLNLEMKEGLRQEDILDQWVAQNRQGLLIADMKNDFRFQTENVEIEENAVISYPFLRGNKMLGLLRLGSLKSEVFFVEDLRLLSILADLAAASLENAHLYQKTKYLATVDGLTNLYVRGYLEEVFVKDLRRAVGERTPLSLLMIDIDHFKIYNDTYGHIVGDSVLKKIGSFLQQKIGSKGKIFRFGGEEFMILLPGVEKMKAIDIAEDIQISLEREIIYVRRKETRITVSIGVAAYPSDGIDRETLIKKVDDALLKAKREGRNKVCAA